MRCSIFVTRVMVRALCGLRWWLAVYEYPAPLCRIPITCKVAVGVAGLRGCLTAIISTRNRGAGRFVYVCVWIEGQ